MTRDVSLDYGKGLAILFVYLGHSIIYHPIALENLYPWCDHLGRFIESFNMPMFFIISGFLFSITKRTTKELYRQKTKRLLIPYLSTMAVIVGMKLFLPMSLSYNKAVGGNLSILSNALLYGGDRWFVYTLYIIFLMLIPLRTLLKNKWVDTLLIMILVWLYFEVTMPKIFRLESVFYYMTFFISGFAFQEHYNSIKKWSISFWYVPMGLFLILNVVFAKWLFDETPFVYRFLLPFTGSWALMTIAFLMSSLNPSKKILRFVNYCGVYSLQFYLFTFAYPFIRIAVVKTLHINSPQFIIPLVFVLQLVFIVIIVEISRRIKWLKVPCGY